jgi:hypothetical protein
MSTSAMSFVIWKSYDGGKHWERACQCPDFGSAAGAAQDLRTQHPGLRFRVDVEPGRAHRSEGGRPRRAARQA